jgi:hypothetical protein
MECVQINENKRDSERIERIERECRWIKVVDPIIAARLSAADFDRIKAGQMAQALHSAIKPKAIDKLLQKVDQDERPAWASIEFWRKDIDHVLLGGALNGKSGREEAIKKVRSVWTKLASSELEERMQLIASDNLPPWLREVYWEELDPILMKGVAGSQRDERVAIKRILELRPELRPKIVAARAKYFHRIVGTRDRTRIRCLWTESLDAELRDLSLRVNASEAVTALEAKTHWSRTSIRQRAQKLGLFETKQRALRPWTEPEIVFVLERVNHSTVKEIARQLDRSGKSVSRWLENEGLSYRCEEGVTATQLRRMLGVRHATIAAWIEQKLISRTREGRFTDRYLNSFFRKHRSLLKWDELTASTKSWILEIIGNDDEADQGSEFMSPRGRRDAKPQKPEEVRASEFSIPHRNAPSISQSEPSGDAAPRNSRGRVANSQP